MAIADSKKAQTIRNLWHSRVAENIVEANAVVAQIRAAILANDLVGEFSLAERDAMQAVESSLASLAELPGVTQAAGKYRPGHTTEQDQVGLEI